MQGLGGGDRAGVGWLQPVAPSGRVGWEGSLATITLDGPEGSVTLSGDTDIPMAILRNRRTVQIRGNLRDPPPATLAAAATAARPPSLEVGLRALVYRTTQNDPIIPASRCSAMWQ